MTGCIARSGLKCCGQDATCTVGYARALAYWASGLEFSPQIRPVTLSSPTRMLFSRPVHQALADRGHELLVLVGDRAVGIDVDLRVPQRAGGVRAPFADADDGSDPVLAAGPGDRVDRVAGDLDGV